MLGERESSSQGLESKYDQADQSKCDQYCGVNVEVMIRERKAVVAFGLFLAQYSFTSLPATLWSSSD